CHVMPNQLESAVVEQGFDIAPRTGEKIVDTEDFRPLRDQALAKMRAQKTGTPCHQHAYFEVPKRSPPCARSPASRGRDHRGAACASAMAVAMSAGRISARFAQVESSWPTLRCFTPAIRLFCARGKDVDGRDERAVTPVFDGRCAAMTNGESR